MRASRKSICRLHVSLLLRDSLSPSLVTGGSPTPPGPTSTADFSGSGSVPIVVVVVVVVVVISWDLEVCRLTWWNARRALTSACRGPTRGHQGRPGGRGGGGGGREGRGEGEGREGACWVVANSSPGGRGEGALLMYLVQRGEHDHHANDMTMWIHGHPPGHPPHTYFYQLLLDQSGLRVHSGFIFY